jgi:calcineurin-like phosphoesterase family protein
MKRYISDLHFGHKNMAQHRGFQDEFYQDEFIIDSWNSVIKSKKDITYILGDVTMEKKAGYELLSRLNGVKHIILGNHDRRQDVNELLKHVDSVCSVHTENNVIFTHIPIHPRELQFRYKINVHGHLHEHIVELEGRDYEGFPRLVPDLRYINVSCEQVNYKPKTLEELLNR